jgi:hypothetical protein
MGNGNCRGQLEEDSVLTQETVSEEWSFADGPLECSVITMRWVSGAVSGILSVDVASG